jgi:TolB-like protein/Tfp pilus assembly protein PilF
MSSDEEQEYFSDGLTEELLNLLARIPELRVTSRSSAFYYKGKDFKIADVGRELGVGHILEGSVRRSGETIRITAQLINVADDAHIWSETWDRTFDDIFVIQDEIAEAVVGELKVRLAGQVPQVADTDPEAYSLYLRARHLVDTRTVQNYEKAMQFLQAALAIDSEFAAAWLELGKVYWVGRGIGMFAQKAAISNARDAANKVLKLDPDNARAHMLRSRIASSLEMDMVTASREIQRALELNPNDADILRTSGFVAARIGDFDGAIELFEKAKLLDPVGENSWYGTGLGEIAAGRLDEAEDAFRKAIELAPEGIGNHQRLAMVLLLKGQYDAALGEANKEPVEGRRASVRALIFPTTGDFDQAVREHDLLIASGERWTYEIAQMYAYRGMTDEAFHWLERALARKDSSLSFVSWDPFLDNIRGDPRFDILEERLGINRE